MKWQFPVFVASALLSACTLRHRAIAPVVDLAAGWRPAIVRRAFTADSAFTPDEVAMLYAAADRLQEQTEGRISILLYFDEGDAGRSRIHRRTVADPEAVSARAFFGGSVYAWTSQLEGVNLIAGLLTTRELWLHVTMHELLHAIGVRHVDDPQAIMGRNVTEYGTSTNLHQADMFAIASAVGCAPWVLREDDR